jgi:molybdenum cofactor cytidylyltransferase
MAQQVSAILLAAGSARRMGRMKHLLPIGDRSVIRHCLERIVSAGINDIVVVLGLNGRDIANDVLGFGVKIVINPDPESEMAGSVRCGLRLVDASSTGVLVCLSDHPLVSQETFGTLLRHHYENPDRIIVPFHHGRRGHPTLFPARVIEEIFSGIRLNEIVNRSPERLIRADVIDEGVLLDMDTPEDYRKVLQKMGVTG